jgi:hypothetical protein
MRVMVYAEEDCVLAGLYQCPSFAQTQRTNRPPGLPFARNFLKRPRSIRHRYGTRASGSGQVQASVRQLPDCPLDPFIHA